MDQSAFFAAVAFEELAPAASAIGISENIRVRSSVDCTFARVTVEDNAVRYRLDGGNPTATVGHALAVGAPPLDIYGAANVRNFRVIAQTGTASVMVTTGLL